MAAHLPAKTQTRDQITAEVAVRAVPTVVWDRLAAFDQYATWGAPIRMKGEARPGGTVAYSVRARFAGAGDRWTNFSGRITTFEPGARLRMQVGYRFWLRIELEFVLQHAGEGTNVEHSARMSGALSALGGRRLRTVFATAVQGTAAALRNTGKTGAPLAPADPPQPNRKARRAGRASRS